MTHIRDLIKAASVAHAMREGVEALMENAITSEHTMDACLAIVRVETNEERDRLSEALLLDVVGRMQLQLDKAIDHLEKRKE